MYERLRLGEALTSSCEFLTLTFDEWSADNVPGVALLSLTTHWIDEKFNRRYAMLHEQKLKAAHTGEYLAQMMIEMVAGWHLRKDRVHYVLGDNDTEILMAMRTAGCPHIGCMAHTHFNLL